MMRGCHFPLWLLFRMGASQRLFWSTLLAGICACFLVAGSHTANPDYTDGVADDAVSGQLDGSSQEERLYNRLFSHYNPVIRPVRRATDTVHASLTFSLMQMHSLDEKAQVFRAYGWLIVEWTDLRLAWPSEQFDNMTQFVVDSQTIWTPELALINAVEYQFPDFAHYKAIVSSNGNVRWEPAGTFQTSCKIDITFYPYDVQECSLVFGTWAYTSLQVNLSNSSSKIILDDYNESGEWDITDTVVERQEFIYGCCPDMRFSKVSAKVFLTRRHRFYTMNLVMPCGMLSSLTLVTFLSPPDQGEKISLGISILLSFSVFMLTLSENMPKTSESLPLFGIYTTFVMLMNTSSVMLTVLVLNLHHRNQNSHKSPPRWVRKFVFGFLARVLCMHSKTDILRSRREGPFSRRFKCQDDLRRNSSKCGKYDRDSGKYLMVNSGKKGKLKDGFSLQAAAAQFSGKVGNSPLLFPNSLSNSHGLRVPGLNLPPGSKNLPGGGGSPGGGGANGGGSGGGSGGNQHGNSQHGNNYTTSYSQEESQKLDYESLLVEHHEYQLTREYLQEWRRLARVVDRLFFWLTLLSLISVSVGMFCLLWIRGPSL